MAAALAITAAVTAVALTTVAVAITVAAAITAVARITADMLAPTRTLKAIAVTEGGFITWRRRRSNQPAPTMQPPSCSSYAALPRRCESRSELYDRSV